MYTEVTGLLVVILKTFSIPVFVFVAVYTAIKKQHKEYNFKETVDNENIDKSSGGTSGKAQSSIVPTLSDIIRFIKERNEDIVNIDKYTLREAEDVRRGFEHARKEIEDLEKMLERSVAERTREIAQRDE